MKIAIISITAGGQKLATKIAEDLPEATLLSEKGIAKTMAANWPQFDGFICIMASGIVVRAIAPLLADKRTDPCVLVVNEKGRHVISLLSGHLGGGNELARQVAEITGGEAVITTASDTLGLVALDIWAKDQHLTASRDDLTGASAKLVNNGSLTIYSEVAICSLPEGLNISAKPEGADIIISNKKYSITDTTIFCPRNLVVGVGCNRGTPAAEFTEALSELFSDLNLNPAAIRNLASIDKKNDEAGLLAWAAENSWPIDFFNKDALNKVAGVEKSAAALKAVGAIGVAEPAAILSAAGGEERGVNPSPSVPQNNNLICRKRKWQNITMAVAQAPFTLSVPAPAV